MRKEMKDNLLFAIFTGENENKPGNDMAKHIANKMRTVYGGYWSVFASYNDLGNKFNWLEGNYAAFNYANDYEWHVYKTNCGSSDVSTMANDPVGFSYSLTDFDSSTTMNSSVKNNLQFAIWASEVSDLGHQETVDRIYEIMERVYGGGWSVHFNVYSNRQSRQASSHFSSIPGYYARFTSNGTNSAGEFFVSKQMC